MSSSKPFRQEEIDQIRTAVIMQCLVTAVIAEERRPKVRHLWFPRASVSAYELREGNPPADSERPLHLRGKRLEVDVGEISPETARAVRAMLKRRRQVEMDPTKPFLGFAKARQMVESMREKKRLVRLPWEN
jgi:hypothetical protein